MKRILSSKLIVLPLIAQLIFATACGPSNFALDLRVVLAASGPLIQSLPISPALKSGLVVDFTDLASGAATLAEGFKACGDSKTCKLDAVDRYEALFENVQARGHFGGNAKLQTILGIVKGIIGSARIYFGGAITTPQVGAQQPQPVTEKDIKQQIERLKKEMQP
jgi:hypothetical protein